ncbi:MAG: hypothetical protein N3A71_01860 [Candidatus Dojkabacteria bacterium]|nr:hypothetical protein [Candidatus Dojkabacteria bacterium]
MFRFFIIALCLFISFFVNFSTTYAHSIPFVVHEFSFDYQEKKLFIDYKLRIDPIIVDKIFEKIDYNRNELLDQDDAQLFFRNDFLSNIEGSMNDKIFSYEFIESFEVKNKKDLKSFDDYWGFRIEVKDTFYQNENLIKFKSTLRFLPEDEYGDSYYYDDNLFDNKHFSVVVLQSDYENIDVLSYKVRFAKKDSSLTQNQNKKENTNTQNSFSNINLLDIKSYAESIINYVRTIDITSPFVFFTFAGLLILAGALHSLTPGHGKTLISTIFISRKNRNFIDLIILALSLTFSHTLIVFIVGLSVFLLQKVEYLNMIVRQFEILGYVLFIFVGLYLIFQGLQNRKHYLYHAKSCYAEDNHHVRHQRDNHHHHHFNLSRNFRIRNRRDILWAGFVGGITPCINATVVFTFFLIQGETFLGIISILLYSIGMATGIILIGTTVFYGFKKLNLESKLGDRLEYILPIWGGLIIVLLGLYYIFT